MTPLRNLRSKSRPCNKRQLGNVMLEFAIVGPMLAVTLLGVVGVGFTLGRTIQVNQVTRDSAKLFFDGVDLSQGNSQKLIGRLGWGMGLSTDASGTIDTAGKGVVILSQIIHVGANECAAGGYPNTGSCPNFNQLVVQKRIVIGNTSLRSSRFGSPIVGILKADGAIRPADFCTDSSVLVPAGSPPTLLNLAPGQFTYGVESFFVMPELVKFLAHEAYSFLLL